MQRREAEARKVRREREKQYQQLEVELESVSYCNVVLFKLGLNCEMYSWVVHFLNYFISISERCRNREVTGGGVGKLKVFIY